MTSPRRAILLAVTALAALAIFPASATTQEDELPDPLDRGPYTATRLDPFLAGTVALQEPNSGGGAPTGSANPETFQVRGSAFYPSDREEPSPMIILVHGNHGSCDSGSAPDCTVFKRNDEGYAYLAENLATWGYTVFSLDQDQLMSRQDSAKGKGMHQRRRLIAAALDALYAANSEPQPIDPDNNLGDTFTGNLDMTRIGLMGHSRGGDAVTSFIDYNRNRADGRRYPLRGVISLAPVDYERKAPYGTPYMTILPHCDGDVSNLQGARFFERSQYVNPDDPFPRIQVSHLGANHNWYNTVWFADGGDSGTGSDTACVPSATNSSRLSGQASSAPGESYVIDNSDKLNPELNTRISPDPARMGDQEKIGLATMAAFFRRYVGGEGAFDPYMTGELAEAGEPQIPSSACPTSESGTRMPCEERASTTYFGPADERLDVIHPEATNPLGLSALGTRLSGSGFSNPYTLDGGVQPVPETTPSGVDWCNPEPEHFAPSQLGISDRPTAAKPCPLPADAALGGQGGTRENAPVNHSYGRQLSLAWDDPVTVTGEPANLSVPIPAADADLSGFKALAMDADVNFFDPRNPARTGTDAEWNPALTTQDFAISLTDADGNTATVSAANPHYGNALHQTTGSTTARTHIVLEQIRVPLTDFDGVDLTSLTELELTFGDTGYPATGSIQLADVRFQEPTEGTDVLVDTAEPDAGPSTGPPSEGPDPADILDGFDPSPGNLSLPDNAGDPNATGVWTVDDDRAECPDAQSSSIQQAVNYAAPWDEIVVCPGLYEESSTPVNHTSSPSEPGSMNGLTITKPLRIKGAGADQVTIRPAPSLGPSLAGTAPDLRDGGGNVITISRQSLGSTDDNEHFVDISGVTVESPVAYAEAGIAFLNASGRISDSVVGPLQRATAASQLAERPHGWGIISTNSILGSGPGTVVRQVTVDHSYVTGYQSGGILFDTARGTDGHADNTTRSQIITHGYVTDSFVDGHGPSSLIPQTGIQYHAGVDGFVEDSRVTGNLFPTNQRKSAGILLTDAGTEADWHTSSSASAGNGYGLFNADIANTAIRDGAPALAAGNWWGPGGPPIEGESLPSFGIEGVSGDDTNGDDSVLFDPTLNDEPDLLDGPPGPVADAAPTGAIIDPADNLDLEVGETVKPVVAASDDFGVKSVSLTAGGTPAGADSSAPYEFEWAPTADDAGETVTLETTITDSAGQTTTSSINVNIAELPEEPTLEIIDFTRDKEHGTAEVHALVNLPGTLTLTGQGVKPAEVTAAGPGTVPLPVKATGHKKNVLKKDGQVFVTVEVAYVPEGADPEGALRETLDIKLVKR